MPYSYTGNFPDQQFKNTGVFNPKDELNLTSFGEWGGSLQLIETVTASSSSEIEFNDLDVFGYEHYFINFFNIVSSTSNQYYLRFSDSNGASYFTSNYHYAADRSSANGNTNESRSTSGSNLVLSTVSGTGNSTASGYIYLYNLLNSTTFSFSNWQTVSIAGADKRSSMGGGVYPVANIINAVKIYASTGNIAGGKFNLYGLKEKP